MIENKLCKAKTKNNVPCGYQASLGEYCAMHWKFKTKKELKKVEKNKKLKEVGIVLFFIVFFLSGILIGLHIEDIKYYVTDFGNPTSSESNITELCSNLTIGATARCLNDELEPYFNYIITDDNPSRSIDDILQHGGDCYDYTRVYMAWGKELGYNVDKVRIIDDDFAHAFAVIHDETGYCTLDQITSPKCLYYGDDK